MRSRHRGLVRSGCLTVLSLATALALTSTDADARRHGSRHHVRPGRFAHHAFARVPSTAGIAAMVVEAGSGRTLYASHENDLRHPASITKVMTLYLLFEKLAAGEMRLDTRIGVSAHAASMAPTKLGLRPGSSIAVEDAIKSIVTKSANDMAVAVAEAVGGDEATFASLMTRKAHALGMSRTVYVNASGLPDDRQITTARDLTVLGRAIHEQFPRYYHFFSTPSFTYAGETMLNHNHLMSRLEGMDGIKTGYTRASGFNLLSSVSRDGHRIVSVVLGGRSAASRDTLMASLIEQHIEDAAPTRLADVEAPSPVEEPAPTVPSYGRQAVTTADRGPGLIAPTLAIPPLQRPFDRARTPGQPAAAGSPIERARPAFIAGTPRLDPARSGETRRLAEDGSTSADAGRHGTASIASTATPSSLRGTPSARPPVVVASLAPPLPVSRPENALAAAHARPETTREAEDAADHKDAAHSRGDWIIQIGATDAPDKATDLLDRAKSQGNGTLASARPFTEKVRKGEATLYRARFAGLDTTEAEQACRALKRSGFGCFATKD